MIQNERDTAELKAQDINQNEDKTSRSMQVKVWRLIGSLLLFYLFFSMTSADWGKRELFYQHAPVSHANGS